jgi:hypothetical protein
MMNYKKEKTISIPDQNVEIDVRSHGVKDGC